MTNAQLDREEQQSHTFTVVAIDSGSPPRTGNAFLKSFFLDQSPFRDGTGTLCFFFR